ncbi:hypothetical protein HBH56_233210 [Parastagonospora nodorum]|uniref:Uncharacterized protein n=2 Tax=Phaeosphaeria nodorum (strain SN15 / ATCC MYA-4574 / FGSC 10173) TaxID=321614 RepID=A0A7U2NRA5_PHANO|nr:hypothetical protein SNOG_16265 [Parastagonospora nodorum SN15]KAH3904602.1 hypothetical protein HBH56_233210 [Parastagonospora nodorum]EAT76449.2 hypothetical protein SNOG_16265 [Parastagonospora nodorum SN15]KAH3921432.1 hypothetical protein HBH54_239840 [Parastagonospora nodorum]KAH3939927.1 hypothetical protein HBH53_226300 [Parastagonospora nodorum]KAH3994081.1 hypothetical protein HBI10_193690 [Parastagonospora nodorum]
MSTQSATVEVPYDIWRQPDAFKALSPTAAITQLIGLNDGVHKRNQLIIVTLYERTDRLEDVGCAKAELDTMI